MRNIQSVMGTLKKTWRKVNKDLGRSKPKSVLPSKLCVNLEEITNPKLIADKLNSHFVQKRINLANELPKSEQSIFKTMGPRNEHSISYNECKNHEVLDCIKNANINKAMKGIPPKIIKWLADDIAPVLTKIFNKFFDSGIYPKIFKIAKVTALSKGGDKTDGDNYRPISVLTQLNQIFEKLIHSRLYEFMKDKLHTNQFGFQKGHSTAHAITSLHEHLVNNIERHKVSALLFLDLKSAFDTVNPEILIQKLEHYGVRGKMLLVLSSYLHDRKQYVKGDVFESIVLSVLIGVPQGSVLGPLLFIIYINDIVNCSKLFAVLFADDAALVASDEKIKKVNKIMNAEMKLISKWLVANRLTLNLKKTKFMVICNKKGEHIQKLIKKFKVNINNYCIKQVSEFKYLGLLFNNKLNWHNHIEYLCTKISKAVGVLSQLKYRLPRPVLKMIYHSLIASYLRYGVITWGSAKSTAMKKLNSLNDRALKIISPRNVSLDAAYQYSKALTIESLFKFELAKFIHAISTEKQPKAFTSYVIPISHTYQTRARENGCYQLYKPQTKLGKTLIKFKGVKYWNTLPRNITCKHECGTSQLFKVNMKEYLLTRQNCF